MARYVVPSRVVLFEAVEWCIILLYPKNSTWRWLRAISTPRSEKCPFLFNDRATSELSMRACSWNVTDSKKNYFDLIIPRYIQICQSKEMSHDAVLNGLTPPNAAPIEIHVNCLNSMGRFHPFSTISTYSVAYHDKTWSVLCKKHVRYMFGNQTDFELHSMTCINVRTAQN